MKRTHRASYSVEGRADGPSPFLFFISVTITSARMKKEDYEPLVKRTLADFDFGTVHKCMTALDWEWVLGDERRIPSIGELYQRAEELLVRAAQKECSCSSGGFIAFSDGTSVELCFTVEEADCSIYELEEISPSNP